jgi:putative YphP/YqiW family bacilliredoxin
MIKQDDFIRQIEAELLNAGFIALKTENQVINHFREHKGITLLVINSICGCAGSGARMVAIEILKNCVNPKIDNAVTVFPGVDEEATQAIREYLYPYPLSSPMIVIIKNGEIISCMERHQIKGHCIEDIKEELMKGIASAIE